MLEAVPREHNLQLYMRYAGIFVLRTSKERKAFFRRRHTTLISFAGMAELADALDSGSVTSVNALTTCYKSRFGDLTPYKN